MWVHEDDVEKTFRICEETKTECGYHLVSRYGDATAEKHCFQREDDGVQFDLFRGAIYYRNRMFIDGDTILRHIHDYQGVCVLDDNFADLIAFLKEILNNGKCATKYVAPVIGNEVFSENYLKDNLCNFSPTFAEKNYLFIINRKTDDEVIAQLAVAAQQALSSSTDVSRLGIAWHKLLRLFRHPGFVISFDNERDGSGKDCMAEVAKRLDGGFHHGVTKCHSNPTIKQVLYIFFGKSSVGR